MTETFTMNEVHTHYTCKCEIEYPDITLDRETGKTSIVVKRRCQQCKKGRIIELVLGKVATKIPRCKQCNCNEMTVTLTPQQFISFLKPSHH